MAKKPVNENDPPEPEQLDAPDEDGVDPESPVENEGDAATAAMNFVAPVQSNEPKLMSLKLVRPIALGYGTRLRGLHIGHALTDPQYNGALDLESIQWADGADQLNERERATLLANPHLIAAEQAPE